MTKLSLLLASAIALPLSTTIPIAAQQVSTGQAAFADYTQQKPGARRKVTIADLPAPSPQEAVDNGAHMVPRPANAWPQVPAGFKVSLYAGGDSGTGSFKEPRLIRTAPNGDLFLADSAAGTIWVLRGAGADGKAGKISPFATGLDHPFGIAFYPAADPKFIYVANTTTVVRFAYKSGDVQASGKAEMIVPDLPGYAQLRGGGHWTRDVVFSPDGSKMLVSVGSGSNIDDPDTHPREFHRADVLEYTPAGKFLKIYASGLRNCVGEAINPTTGQLWCSVNERDNLGNHLVPDYVTSVPEDGFFGWPWFYMGGAQGGKRDPRLPETHGDLQAKVITPDVLVQPHMASLEMVFAAVPTSNKPATGSFPATFNGDVFAAEHGSWNRAHRAGYEVIHIPMHNGHPVDGSYEDFLTGFVTPDGEVWGRPVGVTIAKDGSMFVTDDGSKSVWHVTYVGGAPAVAAR